MRCFVRFGRQYLYNLNKREKHQCRSVIFSQVAGSTFPPWVFFTIFKLYKRESKNIFVYLFIFLEKKRPDKYYLREVKLVFYRYIFSVMCQSAYLLSIVYYVLPIFMADIKIIVGYNCVSPLNLCNLRTFSVFIYICINVNI